MNGVELLKFDQPRLLDAIDALDNVELDSLDFGAIAFDASTLVRRYNAFESELAGLAPQRVIGFALFSLRLPLA